LHGNILICRIFPTSRRKKSLWVDDQLNKLRVEEKYMTRRTVFVYHNGCTVLIDLRKADVDRPLRIGGVKTLSRLSPFPPLRINCLGGYDKIRMLIPDRRTRSQHLHCRQGESNPGCRHVPTNGGTRRLGRATAGNSTVARNQGTIIDR